jgi:hypothetical protein
MSEAMDVEGDPPPAPGPPGKYRRSPRYCFTCFAYEKLCLSVIE